MGIVKRRLLSVLAWKAGVMTVMSGRWEPPASCGWFETKTSPWSRIEVGWG